ncbi:MAG: hypothetical protein JRH15_22525 [Deltaproteobacteria bacterium]|nr:hypothetical protein [Deltaproteobacteria bacterium]
MALPVKLKDIIYEMEMQFDSHSYYLYKKTGEIVLVTDEHYSVAEDEEDISHYPDWEQEAIQVAIDLLKSEEDYLPLPSQFEIHEYEIMEAFCLSLDDENLKDKMYRSIKGGGAFRRFKDNIYEYGIEQNWFQYRREAFKRIAIDWCEENNIPYTEKT